MFATTEGLVLARDLHWKPSAANTVTVSKQTKKVPDFPVIVIPDSVAYQSWKDISYVQLFL